VSSGFAGTGARDAALANACRHQQAWGELTGNGQHLPTGYSLTDRLGAILRFGVRTAEDATCMRPSGALSASEFPTRGARDVRRIDAAQADAIRTLAHKKKLHSMALARAVQFDL
jgi:hypothetical protein